VKGLAVLGVMVACCLLGATAAAAAEDPAAMYEPGDVGVVYLTLSPTEQSKLEAEPDEYVEGTFSFAETDGTPTGVGPATTPITVGIRLKGQLGSKRTLAQKAAFKLKLNWVKGQKFRGLKKMTLNNMVQDPSEIHETLSYRLFRDAGVAAPRTGFAYVYLNGIDYGMHLNIETLDDVALEQRFGPFEHLYEGGYGSDVETGAADTPEEVTAAAKKFEVDEGDEENISDLEGLIVKVNDQAGGDFSQRIESIVELREMTRMWAVEKYVGHWDGYAGQEGGYWPNNYYLFSDSQGRFQMLPWGTDQTWGSRLDFTGDAGILFDKCLADPSCEQMYVNSLRGLPKTVEDAGLDSLATQTAALLKPWEEREQGNGGHHEHGMAEIEGAVQSTRNFIAVRPGDLSTFLAAHPQIATVVTVALQSSTITADGTSTTTATATVTDAAGDPVPGEAVAFASSDPGQTIGPVTAAGDGTYAATITASTVPGSATITATDSSVTVPIAGTATLTQSLVPPPETTPPITPPATTTLQAATPPPPPPATPPTVHITAAPSRITSTRAPRFRFAADRSGAGFRCRIDSRRPVACSSPYTTPRLGDGRHQFSVTAVNAAGQAGRSASYLFRVLPSKR
jgi:spore coat protein CotH